MTIQTHPPMELSYEPFKRHGHTPTQEEYMAYRAACTQAVLEGFYTQDACDEALEHAERRVGKVIP